MAILQTIHYQATMKRLTAVLSILLSFAFLTTLPANAQQPQRGMMMRPDSMMRGPMQGQMMGGGMMQMMRGMHQQMMQNPMHRTSMMTFMLPALADTLGLSEEQTTQLNQLKSEAMAQRQEHQQQMNTHRQELMGLFDGDEQPATEAVREHVMAMAEMRANQQAALYETAQQMRNVLTDAQRQMLDGMTPQQMMHQMMSNMPMMEMMQMMRSMHGGMMGNGMMGRGMMPMMQNMPMRQGGMMQQGMRQNMPMHRNRHNQ